MKQQLFVFYSCLFFTADGESGTGKAKWGAMGARSAPIAAHFELPGQLEPRRPSGPRSLLYSAG
jgi:hypothetical protein